jgi:hypothetical protein
MRIGRIGLLTGSLVRRVAHDLGLRWCRPSPSCAPFFNPVGNLVNGIALIDRWRLPTLGQPIISVILIALIWRRGAPEDAQYREGI